MKRLHCSGQLQLTAIVFVITLSGCSHNGIHQSQEKSVAPTKQFETADPGEVIKRISATTDPKKVQLWAQEIIRSYETEISINMKLVPREKIPEFILHLDPRGEPTVLAHLKSKKVSLDWGGGFMHWGIVIGATTPENKVGSEYAEWIPGIYAFRYVP